MDSNKSNPFQSSYMNNKRCVAVSLTVFTFNFFVFVVSGLQAFDQWGL